MASIRLALPYVGNGSSANMLAVLLGYPDNPPLLLASLEEEALKRSNIAWDHIHLVVIGSGLRSSFLSGMPPLKTNKLMKKLGQPHFRGLLRPKNELRTPLINKM